MLHFVLERNPHTSRRLTQAETLERLRAEHERGHVHSAWFKDAMLYRCYANCNCCECRCGGVEAMMKRRSEAVWPFHAPTRRRTNTP